MRRPFLKVLMICFTGTLASCSMLNMFNAEADYQRNYSAKNLKMTIDESVREELAKEPPNGWKTKPYAPPQWDSYWNALIYYNGTGEFHKAYRGPSKQEWVRYIIQSRRAAGLRPLNIEPRNKEIVEQAMRGNGRSAPTLNPKSGAAVPPL